MVRFALTAVVQSAAQECSSLLREGDADRVFLDTLSQLSSAELGSPVEHSDLIAISNHLKESSKDRSRDARITASKRWGLDSLLRGTIIYQAPPPPKPEQSPEYKALMQRLRQQEEERQYERMINPAPVNEVFSQRFPSAAYSFNPATSHGQTGVDEVDEVTYQDVERQMALIINVLVSIIACSVAIWIAARHWSVPQRLALSLTGSCVVAIAEVAIYMGYIMRVQDAKVKENKKVERKEVEQTWVIERSSGSSKPSTEENIRFRKGKHR